MTHYIALGVCIILVPIAQTLMKVGSNSGETFIRIARHPSTLAGLAILIVVTLLTTYSFQIVEMKTSAAWTSSNYILVVLASRYTLGERVSFSRLIGCGLIATGIVIFQFA